jgi:hypothetical protein
MAEVFEDAPSDAKTKTFPCSPTTTEVSAFRFTVKFAVVSPGDKSILSGLGLQLTPVKDGELHERLIVPV